MNIEIYPLEKVVIDGISICLGMEQAAVENAIGKGELVGDHYYYYDSDMAIYYSDNRTVEFIDFLGGHDGIIQPKIYGEYVFKTKADELYNILYQNNHGDIDDHEDGYSYAFLNISVGIYRSSIPEGVQEMIAEAEENGEPMEPEEIEYEMNQANYWATIGIGVDGYYR